MLQALLNALFVKTLCAHPFPLNNARAFLVVRWNGGLLSSVPWAGAHTQL